ncbi:MAG: YHS domain-containing (seleno)protein [Blastocatellia bacterium]
MGIFTAACGSSGAADASVELVSKTADGLAIGGYDSVAYHTVKAATKGKPEFEYLWKGAKWLFSSVENRDKFAADPEAYSPEYGGYCAYSVADNKLKSSDPEMWKIVDGKLYLIQSGEIKEIWEKNQDGFLERSNENWKKMK